jgi:hypothetical protein
LHGIPQNRIGEAGFPAEWLEKTRAKKIPPPKIRPPGRSDDRAETPGGGLPY